MSDNPNLKNLIDTSRGVFTPGMGPQGIQWPGINPSFNEERQIFNLERSDIPNIISNVTNGITPGHHPDAQGFLGGFLSGMVQGTNLMGDTFALGPGTLNVSNGNKSFGLDFRNRGASFGTGGDNWRLGISGGMGPQENPNPNAMLTFGFSGKKQTLEDEAPATFLNQLNPSPQNNPVSAAQEYANQTIGPSWNLLK